MNWEAVGAIAEATGVVAIFVSLIYVATQIRQNTQQISRSVRESELAAFERNIESGNGIRELLILHPDVAKLFLTGLGNFSELERLEKLRFGMLLRNMLSSLQGAYIRQLSAREDPNDSTGIAGVVDSILINPGVREWLARNSPDWRPEFQAFVAERLRIIEAEEEAPQA